jgi:hypothetical protein
MAVYNMMDETFFHEIQILASKYFTDGQITKIINELKQWDISKDWAFYQMTQEEDEPKLEILFMLSRPLLLEYTYRSSKTNIVSIPFDKIEEIILTDWESQGEAVVNKTDLKIMGSVFTLRYIALGARNRKSLKRFHNKIQGIYGHKKQDLPY